MACNLEWLSITVTSRLIIILIKNLLKEIEVYKYTLLILVNIYKHLPIYSIFFKIILDKKKKKEFLFAIQEYNIEFTIF